jgi:hypothetical protein
VDEWLTSARSRLAAAANVDETELQLDEGLLLEVARVAAHDSGARTNAPLACYLLGLAVARSDRAATELARVMIEPNGSARESTASSAT